MSEKVRYLLVAYRYTHNNQLMECNVGFRHYGEVFEPQLVTRIQRLTENGVRRENITLSGLMIFETERALKNQLAMMAPDSTAAIKPGKVRRILLTLRSIFLSDN